MGHSWHLRLGCCVVPLAALPITSAVMLRFTGCCSVRFGAGQPLDATPQFRVDHRWCSALKAGALTANSIIG